eukprot:13207556-Alexandrium_andersonii.AAC.1
MEGRLWEGKEGGGRGREGECQNERGREAGEGVRRGEARQGEGGKRGSKVGKEWGVGLAWRGLLWAWGVGARWE